MKTSADADTLARDEIIYLPVSSIDPDPDQPRLVVDDELADSIKQHGVLQAIEVRPHPSGADDKWMLVDGERRYQGAKRAHLKTIPATITLAVEDPADRIVRQLVRNEGKRLTPFEEAHAYKRIIDDRRASGKPKYGVVQLAEEIGVAKSTVGDRLAIAELPAPFVPLFKNGELTAAAAPILRKFAEVPADRLTAAVKEARDHFDWEEALRNGGPVPLALVEDILVGEIQSNLQWLSPEAAKRYKGPTVKADRREGVFAIDVEAAQLVMSELRAEEGAQRSKASGEKEHDWQREDRERRAKEAKALKKKRDERENVFRGIALRLPTELAGSWLVFAIGGLLDEMQHMSRQLACKALGLEAPKGGGQYGGADYRRALFEFAESLDDGRRAQLLLQLILLHDTSVSPYENGPPKRLKAAAELLGTTVDDLKRVTVTSNPLVAAPKSIGTTFSRIVTGVLKKRELSKALAQMSNEWVLAQLSHIREQLAKFDDLEVWPASRLNPGQSRETAFLAGADRNEVVADLALLEKAAARRGLPGFAPDPAEAGPNDRDEAVACKYCECTEMAACELEEGPCSWYDRSVPVCTNPSCVASYQEDVEASAEDAAYDDVRHTQDEFEEAAG